ncbi:MAG: FHA domain-containing protein, partial [Pirellulaceae bacterium]|nr:FHA domain-containing protein [Pirellulaceae bacterium]
RVVTGSDRGRVYAELRPPITIGREEGNAVQVNDERVSRFHVKIQEDDGRLVVTDLDSTNGTRVNGHPCNLKILRYGDTISIGRTVLIVGTREQVAAWFNDEPTRSLPHRNFSSSAGDDLEDLELSTDMDRTRSASQRTEPCLPKGMSPGQAAELRELLDHLHEGLRVVFDSASVDEQAGKVVMDFRCWHSLIRTQTELAQMIRAIEDPQGTFPPNRDTGM